MATPGSWALQQMVRYLMELAPGPDAVLDRGHTLRVGMERAAEALEAEVAVVLWEGRPVESLGFGSSDLPLRDVLAVAAGDATSIEVPGIGACAAISVSVDRSGQLVLARAGDDFGPEELTIVRALGRILTLSLRSVDAVAAERSLRRESERRAREALRDPLTRLPNRALFLDRLDRAVSRATRHGHSVAVLFMDMDGFKLVNDTLGHASGDDLLRAVGDRLARAVRARDTVARLGGDEFAVLMGEVESIESTFAVAERIREAVTPPFEVAGRPVTIGVSIGIAVGPRPDESPDVLLRDADLAMYRAKAEEPGGYRLFVPSMHRDLVERLELESELRETIGQGRLACAYQPVVDMRTGGIEGVEALVRWNHPERGTLLPGAFLPMAERAGLTASLGNWVLGEACRQMSRWSDLQGMMPPSTLRMAVNVSSSQLVWPGLSALVERTLSQCGLEPERLILEITETAIVADESRAIARLSELREIGIRVALDDFGTGYSSLSRLRELPVDVLKIDRSFVSGLPDDRRLRVLTSNIVRLARELDLSPVGEGVETTEERDALMACDCHFGQGYYYARPLHPDAIGRLLSEVMVLPVTDVSDAVSVA